MILAWLLPRLLGLGSWLKQAGRYLCLHPATALALACALWGLWERHEASKWHREADHYASALHAAQEASAKELARATAEHAAAAKQHKDDNDAADKRVADARADDARVAADLSRRLRAATARDSGPLPAAKPGDVSQGANGPGDAPAGDDPLTRFTQVCVENTRRLWTLHLEAVPGDKPVPYEMGN